jgi:hypothetical protein
MVFNINYYSVLDFVPRPVLKNYKTISFINWVCFRPQVKRERHCVGSLRKG